MSAPLFIVGAGGFGREVFSILTALDSSDELPQPTGFIDDAPSTADMARIAALGSQIVGAVNDLTLRREPFSVVLAIGSNLARRTIADLLSQSPVTFPVVVHPDATIGLNVRLAAGVVVAAGVRLSTNIDVGSHVHIDQNVAVGHDSSLGDFSRLNPLACISGSVSVGPGALIGANATVLQGVQVGERSVVGAGSCVVRDVPSDLIVKGIPAR